MTSQYPEQDGSDWRSDEEASTSGLPAFLLDPRGVFARRWHWMLGCVLVGLAATGTAVLLWTPAYLAEANILISSQQLPEEFVQSTVREDTIANINAMVGRVLSESNLIRLLDEHGLYGGDQAKAPLMKRLQKLRSSISIGPTTKSRSRTRETALVYGISFEYAEPEVAAIVANELAAFFVEASIARRTEQAQRATEFLQGELARDEAALSAQARKVTEFRQNNRGKLPDELDTNLRKLEMLTTEKDGLNTQIAQRLNRMVELASARQTLVKTQNQELLSELRRQLAGELAAHTEEHPNVVALRRRVANQELTVNEELRSATGDNSELGSLRRAEQADVSLMRDRVAAIEAQLIEINARAEQTPRVAEELMALEQEELVLREDYLDTLRKVKEAELAENLESAQQGGQVAILDRARTPGAPVQPMWLTLVGGLAATLVIAVGVAALLELIDPVIVSMDQLNGVADYDVLGSFPEIA